jgi:hypothetical protein
MPDRNARRLIEEHLEEQMEFDATCAVVSRGFDTKFVVMRCLMTMRNLSMNNL